MRIEMWKKMCQPSTFPATGSDAVHKSGCRSSSHCSDDEGIHAQTHRKRRKTREQRKEAGIQMLLLSFHGQNGKHEYVLSALSSHRELLFDKTHHT
jgi:hypothetical protein